MIESRLEESWCKKTIISSISLQNQENKKEYQHKWRDSYVHIHKSIKFVCPRHGMHLASWLHFTCRTYLLYDLENTPLFFLIAQISYFFIISPNAFGQPPKREIICMLFSPKSIKLIRHPIFLSFWGWTRVIREINVKYIWGNNGKTQCISV